MKTNTVAQVYVGTYAKYNSGSIEGAWLDCEDYSSKEEFLEACAELHKDENDPEFMYQDYEGFPERYYSESGIDTDLWDVYLKVDSDEREAFEAYLSIFDGDFDGDYDDFRERYQGEFKSEEDFAYYIVDECGMLDKVPENLRYYFDYEKYARDLFLDGYTMENGHVFYTY